MCLCMFMEREEKEMDVMKYGFKNEDGSLFFILEVDAKNDKLFVKKAYPDSLLPNFSDLVNAMILMAERLEEEKIFINSDGLLGKKMNVKFKKELEDSETVELLVSYEEGFYVNYPVLYLEKGFVLEQGISFSCFVKTLLRIGVFYLKNEAFICEKHREKSLWYGENDLTLVEPEIMNEENGWLQPKVIMTEQ